MTLAPSRISSLFPAPTQQRETTSSQPVYTNDGFHLGFASGLDGNGQRLRVDARDVAPIWITVDAIGASGDGYVVLCRTRAQVRAGDFRQDPMSL